MFRFGSSSPGRHCSTASFTHHKHSSSQAVQHGLLAQHGCHIALQASPNFAMHDTLHQLRYYLQHVCAPQAVALQPLCPLRQVTGGQQVVAVLILAQAAAQA